MDTATDSGTPARAWLPDAATARYQRAKSTAARGANAMPHSHGCCCSSLLTQPFSRRLEPHIPHDMLAIGVDLDSDLRPPPPLAEQPPPPALRSPSRPSSAARPVPRSAPAALRAGPRTARGHSGRAARPTTPRQRTAASAQFGEARETTALALQSVQRVLAMVDERVGALQRENELLVHTLGAYNGGGGGGGGGGVVDRGGSDGGQGDRAELATRLREAHQNKVAPAEYDQLKQRLLREYFGVG